MVFLIIITVKPLINFNDNLKFSFWSSIDWRETRVGMMASVTLSLVVSFMERKQCGGDVFYSGHVESEKSL